MSFPAESRGTASAPPASETSLYIAAILFIAVKTLLYSSFFAVPPKVTSPFSLNERLILPDSRITVPTGEFSSREPNFPIETKPKVISSPAVPLKLNLSFFIKPLGLGL